jgi:hypothetical protein
LHHLEDIDREIKDLEKIEFPKMEEILQEWHRVLKPGGMLMINYTPPEQNLGYWWINRLYPQVLDSYRRITPRIDTFR